MAIGSKRIRALYGILHKRGGWHSYSMIRWVEPAAQDGSRSRTDPGPGLIPVQV